MTIKVPTDAMVDQSSDDTVPRLYNRLRWQTCAKSAAGGPGVHLWTPVGRRWLYDAYRFGSSDAGLLMIRQAFRRSGHIDH